MIVNTSFNLSWEPIVLTPLEVYNTFMQSDMDVLVLEDSLLYKDEQPLSLAAWAKPDQEGNADSDSPWADPSYWEPKSQPQDLRRYLRQYQRQRTSPTSNTK